MKTTIIAFVLDLSSILLSDLHYKRWKFAFHRFDRRVKWTPLPLLV